MIQFLSKKGGIMLRYPKKSHRKVINTPGESADLAEALGIITGDGGINNDWQLVITLNSTADIEYSRYVQNLLTKLFGIEVAVRKRPNQNAMVLVCSSINLIEYLLTIGAVKGNKIKQGIDMPSWVKDNLEFEKAFVRGLIDTDGCLYTHKHTVTGRSYYNLGFCFTSMSKNLIGSVAITLAKHGITPHLTKNGSRIYIYKLNDISKYLEIFQSSNPRITGKYIQWRDAGVV
jgi:DNA-binding transcriptional regulator WhiA